MKKILLSCVFTLVCIFSFSQKEESLVVSGEGKTKTEAIDAALRSAIEQTFGAFVSTNTEILNDRLVKDQIATVSSGNIKKYSEIKYFEINGKSYVTLNATVSIGNLVSYAKSKGSSCELDGATMSAEIRRLQFNRENSKIVLENLITQLEALAPYVYDVSMSTTETLMNGTFKFDIIFRPNKTMLEYEKLLYTTLKSISISEKDGKNLLNKQAVVYPLTLGYVKHLSESPSRFNRIDMDPVLKENVYVYIDITPFVRAEAQILKSAITQYYLKDNLGEYHSLLDNLSPNYSYEYNGHLSGYTAHNFREKTEFSFCRQKSLFKLLPPKDGEPYYSGIAGSALPRIIHVDIKYPLNKLSIITNIELVQK